MNKFRFTEEWFGDIPKDIYAFGYAKVYVDLSENESKIKEVSNRASKCHNPCGRVDHAVW